MLTPDLLNFKTLGLLSGFASATLFALSMLLMLRLRPLERAFFGLAHLYQIHHKVGLAAFLLLLAHPLLLTLHSLQTDPAYALTLLLPSPSQTTVSLGYLGLLLFILFFLSTISSNLPRRRWRQLHQASGLAYGAMLAHLIVARDQSISSWLILAVVLLGALAYAFRLLRLDRSRVGLRYRVVRVEHRGDRVVDLELEPLDTPLRFEAGQFVYMGLHDSADYRACGEIHPYTLTGHPEDPHLHLSIKSLGQCTSHIQELAPGGEATIDGPYGALFEEAGGKQLWIAGGIGVTPFLGRATVLTAEDKVDIVYASPREEDALYLEKLEALVRDLPQVRVHAWFEDRDGRPTLDALEQRVGDLQGYTVVIAGPPAMIQALRGAWKERGFSLEQVRTEEDLLR